VKLLVAIDSEAIHRYWQAEHKDWANGSRPVEPGGSPAWLPPAIGRLRLSIGAPDDWRMLAGAGAARNPPHG
jgi:hypothetical protein